MCPERFVRLVARETETRTRNPFGVIHGMAIFHSLVATTEPYQAIFGHVPLVAGSWSRSSCGRVVQSKVLPNLEGPFAPLWPTFCDTNGTPFYRTQVFTGMACFGPAMANSPCPAQKKQLSVLAHVGCQMFGSRWVCGSPKRPRDKWAPSRLDSSSTSSTTTVTSTSSSRSEAKALGPLRALAAPSRPVP